jgi:hypothetical protein
VRLTTLLVLLAGAALAIASPPCPRLLRVVRR